jgi:myosin heavy subunit
VVDDRTYVFFDSEGLGSTDQHATFDTQLFSLSLLLSSLFVLNTTGTINENALEQLELVVQLTERIKVDGASAKKARDTDNMSSLAQFFPSFLWVLRDFTLELRDHQGNAMNPNDYLEEALRPVHIGPNAKRGAAEKNRIRQAISQVFHTRECVTLVRPVAEERDLQRVSKLDNNSLRSEFRNQIAALKQLIPQLAHPKSIDGVELNGRAFVSLASTYVESINAGSVPTIRTAFQSVQEIQGREAMDNAWNQVQLAVKEHIDSKGETHVWSEEALGKLLSDIQSSALQLIREQALGSPSDISKLESQFIAKHLTGLFESLHSRNAHHAEKGCTQVITQLWNDSGIEDHLNEYTTYAELNKDVAGFWTKYLSLTKKAMPERVQTLVGRDFLDSKREVIFKVLFIRLSNANAAAQAAQQANEANQAAIAKLTAELQSVRADALIGQRSAEVELKALQKEIQRSQKDAENTEKKLRAAEAQLQTDREKHSDSTQRQSALISKLEAQIHSLTADVKRLEQEKIQLNDSLQSTSHSLTLQTSGATKATKKLESDLAAARAAHEREVASLRATAEQADNTAAIEAQKLADAKEQVNIQLRTAQQEIATLKASKNKVTEATNEIVKLKQQLKEQEAIQLELQQQLQQERANLQIERANAAASAAAAANRAALEDNPLDLPQPTRAPLVSRRSLIPSKFTSVLTASFSKGWKRKSAAAPVEEEDEEMGHDEDIPSGGDAFGREEEEEEDEVEAPVAPSKAKAAPKTSKAVSASSAPAATDVTDALNNLRDPNSMTINELKSWLTSLDITFPQKSQPKTWYIDLAYEKLGEPLEQAFPRGQKKKAKK